jgi:hypothetical protein
MVENIFMKIFSDVPILKDAVEDNCFYLSAPYHAPC